MGSARWREVGFENLKIASLILWILFSLLPASIFFVKLVAGDTNTEHIWLLRHSPGPLPSRNWVWEMYYFAANRRGCDWVGGWQPLLKSLLLLSHVTTWNLFICSCAFSCLVGRVILLRINQEEKLCGPILWAGSGVFIEVIRVLFSKVCVSALPPFQSAFCSSQFVIGVPFVLGCTS